MDGELVAQGREVNERRKFRLRIYLRRDIFVQRTVSEKKKREQKVTLNQL